MVLNENFEWRDMPDWAADAFQTKFGMPTKDRLDSGMKLYKFNEYPTLCAPDSKALSPWWSPYLPYKQDAGWEEKLKMAKANGISVREWGRLTSAIKENWNSLSRLLVITLKIPAFAFFGGFSQMSRLDAGATSKVQAGEGRGTSANLPGGATQFYIPNLCSDHVHNWHTESLLEK
jgi:hypothetical protein